MIELTDIPALRDPLLIAAFEGWNDAGEAATSAVGHLAEVWNGEFMAHIDPEDYYDFQVNRPRVVGEDGRRAIQWPTTKVFICPDPGIGHDVILIQGIEPSTRWRSFVAEILRFAEAKGVQRTIMLGALLADVPHTRPIPVSLTSDDDQLRQDLDLEVSTYEGPTGIIGVLATASREVGIPCISCWAAVPHYAGGPPSPKATLSLVGSLESLLGIDVDRGGLEDDARAWERGVDDLAESDEEVAEYVQTLEEATDTAELPEASGDAIAREFEKYLRRRGDDS